MSIGARIPLVLLVAVSATLELALNRIGVHLMSDPEVRRGTLFQVVDQGGLFTFYLTGLLALAAFTWATVVLIRDRNLLKVPDRIAFTFLAALFLPLCSMGLLFSLPEKVAPHLNTAFGLLLVAVVVSFLRQPAPLRAKLGVFYLSAPLLLHCYWLMTQQIAALTPKGSFAEVPSHLFVTAEHLVVVGAFAAFLFFAPFPRLVNLLEPIPVIAAVLVTGAVALLTKYQYLETAQAAYYGLGINLPPPSAHGLMHLAALFFFVLTVGALLMRGPRERGTALGLYLIAVSGFHLQLPYQFLLTLLGVMQVGRSSLDPNALSAEQVRPPLAPSPEAWKAYFQRLAESCAQPHDSGEVVLLQNGGQQVAHVRGQRDGLPFTLRIQHAGGQVERFEATVGRPPKDPPPLALSRRGERAAQRSTGARVKLKLPSFDDRFNLHDGTGEATDLFGDALLVEKVQRLIRGWLGLWPGEGVYYLSQPGPDGGPVPVAEIAFSAEYASTEEIAELVGLLVTLAGRVRVHG
jgi:hypothetical protein